MKTRANPVLDAILFLKIIEVLVKNIHNIFMTTYSLLVLNL